jgi:hypothetical protein
MARAADFSCGARYHPDSLAIEALNDLLKKRGKQPIVENPLGAAPKYRVKPKREYSGPCHLQSADHV